MDDSVSIQAIIDGITDNTRLNPYQIVLYPGYYFQELVLKDWVSIKGLSPIGDTLIMCNTGTAITWSEAGGCSRGNELSGNQSNIANIRFLSLGLSPDAQMINASQGDHYVINCFFSTETTTNNITCVNVSGGNVSIRNSLFDYTQTGNCTGSGATGNKHRALVVRENGSIKISNTEFKMHVEDYDDIVLGIGIHSSSLSEIVIMNCEIHIVSTNQTSFNGTWQAISIGSNTTNTNIQGNHIHMECESSCSVSTGNAYCYKSHTGNGAEIHSTSNRIVIEGFPFSYFAYVNAPNRVISHFDDIIALEEVWGTGNVTAVNSRADGEFYVEKIDLIKSIHGDLPINDLTTGSIDAFMDVVLDFNGSTGGGFHVIDVALSGNASLVNVSAIATYSGVDVIHQHIGSDAVLGKAWTRSGAVYTDVSNAFNTSGTDVTLFGSDNDYMYVGSASMFDNIIVTLDTVASASIFQNAGSQVFEYSLGGATWQSFSPGDDTNGFTQSGTIRFGRAGLTGWATENVNAGGSFYYIRIQRTRNFLATAPIEDTIQIESTEGGEYHWNADGNISCSNVQQKVASGALTDGAPTTAEIVAILGFSSNDVGAGWTTYILDTDGTTNMYQIVSDGSTEWYYVEMADSN